MYVADYIENLNKWVEMNQVLITWYCSWYQIWANNIETLGDYHG
jgi:hypothetical protein